MFRFKAAACAVAAVALTMAPLSSASAHYYRHGYGPLFGIGVLGAAVVGTAAAIATAPFALLGARPYYAAPPAYYAPPPAYYYGPPRGYYAPPPAYYRPPAPYYYGR